MVLFENGLRFVFHIHITGILDVQNLAKDFVMLWKKFQSQK